MSILVFYSWQSDLNSKTNRYFIEDCVKKALKELKKEEKDFFHYNVDRDTANTSGTVDIAATIFKKIAMSDIFIGDISIINSASNQKRTPNPNVLIELGFASSSLGWENIISVFNTAYGDFEDLPFDLRFRRPLVYFYKDSLSPEQKNDAKSQLIKGLKKAINLMDPNQQKIKRLLENAFKNETKESLNLILNTPSKWGERLLYELFKPRVELVRAKEYELDHGLIYHSSRKLEGKEFIEYTQAYLVDIGSMIQIFENTVNIEFRDILGEEENHIFGIKLSRMFERISSLALSIIELEAKLQSIEPPEELAELKNLHLGLSKIYTKTMYELFEKIEVAYFDIISHGNTGQKIHVNVTFPNLLADRASQISQIIGNWVKTNYSK